MISFGCSLPNSGSVLLFQSQRNVDNHPRMLLIFVYWTLRSEFRSNWPVQQNCLFYSIRSLPAFPYDLLSTFDCLWMPAGWTSAQMISGIRSQTYNSKRCCSVLWNLSACLISSLAHLTKAKRSFSQYSSMLNTKGAIPKLNFTQKFLLSNPKVGYSGFNGIFTSLRSD